MTPSEAAFYERPAPEVARALLGHRIAHEEPERVALRIVETEAYLGPEDPGSHATRGPDSQAGRLWEAPGRAYVYVCYGVHHMLNVVAHEPGGIGAVLLRAGEPVEGRQALRARRGREADDELASGPGRLAEALDVTREAHDGRDLTAGPLCLEAGDPVPAERVAVTGRVGLSEGGDRLLRFVDRSSPHLSRPLADATRLERSSVEMHNR